MTLLINIFTSNKSVVTLIINESHGTCYNFKHIHANQSPRKPPLVCPSIPELEQAIEREQANFQHEYGCPMRNVQPYHPRHSSETRWIFSYLHKQLYLVTVLKLFFKYL